MRGNPGHACQKQHRQHDISQPGQVDLPTRVEVGVMGDSGHM